MEWHRNFELRPQILFTQLIQASMFKEKNY